MSPIRLLLADDHRLFRQGVRHVCESAGDIQVVAEAENGAEMQGRKDFRAAGAG